MLFAILGGVGMQLSTAIRITEWIITLILIATLILAILWKIQAQKCIEKCKYLAGWENVQIIPLNSTQQILDIPTTRSYHHPSSSKDTHRNSS